MTILTDYVPISYAGNNVTNSFALTFDYQESSQIVAKTEVVATGVITDLVYGTDFTITPTVNSPASFGTLTLLLGALPSGTNILITRVTDVTQDTSWINNSANPASAFENAVDKLTMIDQEREVTPFDLDGTTDQFLRGDNTLTNTLVGPLGAFVLPADTTAMFIAGQSADASIKVVGGASSQSAFSFGVDGSSNPWDARWVYDPALPAIGWQYHGGSIVGTFTSTGMDVSGTVNATLFTGAADASLITTGTIATARLGSGSGSSNSFLNGLGQFTVPAGGGGGVNTTTTGTFTIAAVSSPQTVPVTSVTGITVGTYLQISDGAHTIIGHVTVISSLNLTVVTDSIAIGSAGNTMASGAAVQLSNVPGQNTIILSDHDNLATPISLITLTGGASDFSGLGIYNQVELYMITPPTGGQVPIRAGILRNALSATSFAGSENLTAGFVGFPTSATGASSLSSASAQYQVPFCSTFGGGKATGVTWGLVGPNNITPASLTPALLNVTNSLTDTQVFSYDSASGHFKMVPNNSTGSGTTAQFYRGDNTFTNSLTGPINIDLSSSTTFRIGVANIFGGTTPVQAYMEPVVSGTPSSTVPLQLSGQFSIGATYNTIDTTNVIEMLQVNGFARATAFRSTGGPWLKIYELGVGGGATTIDLVNGNYQRFTSFGSNVTITLADTSPLPSAQRFTSELTLEFNAMSTFDVTWPGTITWANGVAAPTIANSGLNATGINLVRLVRRQGQPQWIGFVENPSTSSGGTVTSVATGAGLTGGPITTTGTISIPNLGITTAMIANNAVTSAQMANNTITAAQVSASAGFPTSVLSLPGGTLNYLRADGSWAPPPGTGGGGGGPTLAATQTWTGVNTYSNNTVFNSKATFTATPVTSVNTATSIGVAGAYPDTSNAVNISMTNNDSNAGHTNLALTVVQNNGSNAAADQGVMLVLGQPLQNITSGFSIMFQQYGNYRRVNGGDASGVWLNSWSPCAQFSATPDATGVIHSFGSGTVRAGEVNYGNTWADLGFIDHRGGSIFVSGLEFVPDWLVGDTGATSYTKYPASWGISFAASSAGTSGGPGTHWTAMLIDTDAVNPGGVGINAHGGSVSGNASLGINFGGYYSTGINFAGSATPGAPSGGGIASVSAATIVAETVSTHSNTAAITLAQGQAICFKPPTGANTGVYIVYDGTHLKATINGGSSFTNII